MNRMRFSKNDIPRVHGFLLAVIFGGLGILSASYGSPIKKDGAEYPIWGYFVAVSALGILVMLWPTLQRMTGYDTIRDAIDDLVPGRRKENHPSEQRVLEQNQILFPQYPADEPKPRKKNKKKAKPKPKPKPKPKKRKPKAEKLAQEAESLPAPTAPLTDEPAPAPADTTEQPVRRRRNLRGG